MLFTWITGLISRGSRQVNGEPPYPCPWVSSGEQPPSCGSSHVQVSRVSSVWWSYRRRDNLIYSCIDISYHCDLLLTVTRQCHVSCNIIRIVVNRKQHSHGSIFSNHNHLLTMMSMLIPRVIRSGNRNSSRRTTHFASHPVTFWKWWYCQPLSLHQAAALSFA